MAEQFNRTTRTLFKKAIFETGNADGLSEVPSVIKKYYNTFHHSIKLVPYQASNQSNEKEVCFNLQDRINRQQPKYKLGDLVCTTDNKKNFIKGGSTNNSYKLFTTTEVIHETIPSYRNDYLPER